MAKSTITLEDIAKKLTSIEGVLKQLTAQSDLDKDYLSTKEACRFLACHRSMIYNLVTGGKLTKLKLENGRTYYAKNELQKLIETSQTQPSA